MDTDQAVTLSEEHGEHRRILLEKSDRCPLFELDAQAPGTPFFQEEPDEFPRIDAKRGV